jgi:hypothetical protein
MHLAVLVVAIVTAGIVIAVATSDDEGGRAAPPPTTEPAPVEVTSDAPRLGSLDELVAASDVVVRGTVRSTERGRWFGDGSGGPRIRSRLVTLDVDHLLAGEGVEPGSTVLVEEEGWTEDGEPLVVDGAAPSEAGDEGIWFLVDPGDATTGALIVVGAEGRYLTGPDGRAVGAEGDDPLVADLSSGSIDDLAGRISRTPPRP